MGKLELHETPHQIKCMFDTVAPSSVKKYYPFGNFNILKKKLKIKRFLSGGSFSASPKTCRYRPGDDEAGVCKNKRQLFNNLGYSKLLHDLYTLELYSKLLHDLV